MSTVRPTCVRVNTFQIIRPLQQPARLHRIRLWSDVTWCYRFISIVLGHLSCDFVSSLGYLTGCLGHYTVHLCTVIRFARILSFCLRRPAERKKWKVPNHRIEIKRKKFVHVRVHSSCWCLKPISQFAYQCSQWVTNYICLIWEPRNVYLGIFTSSDNFFAKIWLHGFPFGIIWRSWPLRFGAAFAKFHCGVCLQFARWK